jgi:hypothetical protein
MLKLPLKARRFRNRRRFIDRAETALAGGFGFRRLLAGGLFARIDGGAVAVDVTGDFAVRRIAIINHRKFIRIELDPVGNDKCNLVLTSMIPNREIGEIEQEPDEVAEVAEVAS